MPNQLTNTTLPQENLSTKRLFLALLPDQALVKKLMQLQKHFPGRKTPPENLHLTLAFLGNQPQSAIFPLTRFIEQVPFSPFELVLDKLGSFPKSRLSWIGPANTPTGLMQLIEKTRQFLVPNYISRMKQTFRPHITLARQSSLPDIRINEPISWHIDRLALMQSILSTDPGKHPQYHILHEVHART